MNEIDKQAIKQCQDYFKGKFKREITQESILKVCQAELDQRMNEYLRQYWSGRGEIQLIRMASYKTASKKKTKK